MLVNSIDSRTMLNQIKLQIESIEIPFACLIHLEVNSLDVVTIISHKEVLCLLDSPQLREESLPRE